MKFLVMSENKIKNYNIAEKHIVISVTGNKYKHPVLPTMNSRLALLQLKFYDIDKSFIYKKIFYPAFTKRQARKIWKFYNYWKSTVSIVICQCEVGICRSAGIAAGLVKGIGQDDSEYFKKYVPNMLVYRLLLNEANK